MSILISDGSEMEITNATFIGCSVSTGGIMLIVNSNVTVQNLTVINNRRNKYAIDSNAKGLISIKDSIFSISTCMIEGNYNDAVLESIFYIESFLYHGWTTVTFLSNKWLDKSLNIYLYSRVIISDSIFENNEHATSCVYVDEMAETTIQNTHFTGYKVGLKYAQ